ncbi:MAG: ABC transporter permease [Dehalococcoidia bacterium]
MSEAGQAVPEVAEARRRSRLAGFFIRLVREKPLGTFGGAIVLVLLFAGIFADLLAPYEMNEINLDALLAPSSGQNWLGTDQLGRDVLSRIIYGARVSVIIGISATTINIVVATTIGVLSGFLGGKFDMVAQRFVDAWMAFPGLLLLITIMSLVGQGIIQIVLVLGILGGIGASRVVRSAVIGIKENTYFTAAEAIGSTTGRTLFRHVMPNIMSPIIIIFTTTVGGVILAEASLSFLGFGLPPDVASWGGMLSGEGRKYMVISPGLALWPGLALSVVVYGTNMFGDALRDLLDPRLRGGVGGLGNRGIELAGKAVRKREAKARKIQ